MGTILHLLLAVSATLIHTAPEYLTAPAPAVDEPTIEVPAPEASPVRVDVDDLPADLRRSVGWAIALFERADLTLPPLQFVHHGDDDLPCGGYRGVHEVRGARSVIGLCTTDTGPITDATILHELAHAWLEHHMPAARQADFQALRGYEHWRDHGVGWGEQGCEQAAEILVWGLIDRPIGFVTFDDTGCDALDAGYRTLTGSAPLHGYRDLC